MADSITSNLEVDVPEMEMEMDSYPSLFKAAQEYIRYEGEGYHLDSTHAFSAIKQYLAQYETQRERDELKRFFARPMFFNFWEIVSSFLVVVDIDEQNSYGWTALMRMSKEGHTEIVEMFIEAGADLNIQDRLGDSALMWAMRYLKNDIVEMLIEAGAHHMLY